MPTDRTSSLLETGRGPAQAPLLAEDARRLHRILIESLLATGSLPPARKLVERLETTAAALRSGLAALAAADYLALGADGHVTCLYPFSPTPTTHAVFINGQRRFAMCAIDAMGIPAMLDQELDIEGQCAVCAVPIALRVRPGAIVTAAPPAARVVARRDEAEPAYAACCPFTVFACGPEHADQVVRRITGGHVLPLVEALARAEEIFGGLLAEAIPARRPRGKQWEASGDA